MSGTPRTEGPICALGALSLHHKLSPVSTGEGRIVYFQIYPDSFRQWRWRLRASNHEIIAHGESYANKDDCLKAIGLVMSTDRNTPVYEVAS